MTLTEAWQPVKLHATDISKTHCELARTANGYRADTAWYIPAPISRLLPIYLKGASSWTVTMFEYNPSTGVTTNMGLNLTNYAWHQLPNDNTGNHPEGWYYSDDGLMTSTLAAHANKTVVLRFVSGGLTYWTEVMKLYDDTQCPMFVTFFTCGCRRKGVRYGDKHAEIHSEVEPNELVYTTDRELVKRGDMTDKMVQSQVVESMQLTTRIPHFLARAYGALSTMAESIYIRYPEGTQYRVSQVEIEETTAQLGNEKRTYEAKVRYDLMDDDKPYSSCCGSQTNVSAPGDPPLTSGGGATGGGSGTSNASCLTGSTAKAKLISGSTEYNGGFYTLSGVDTPFASGERALVFSAPTGNTATLQQWNGSSWVSVAWAGPIRNVFCERENKWFFQTAVNNAYDKPFITSSTISGGQKIIIGQSFAGCIITPKGINFNPLSQACAYQNPLASAITDSVFRTTGFVFDLSIIDPYEVVCAASANSCQLGESTPVFNDSPC